MSEGTRPVAVRCRGVHKSFGDGAARVHALRGVDLDVPPGELFLLVGPSGCGKTTLISVVAGTLDADAGEVEVFGARLDRMSQRAKTAWRRATLGFVFQQYNLLPALGAAENVAVPLTLNGVPRREARERAEAELERVGLADKREATPSQLSGGQQQRVAIARALVHRPRLLVCDEPTAALDGDTGRRVMDLLREVALSPDRGVVVVTHDNRIFQYGDRTAFMTDGRVDRVEAAREPAAR
ncbi:MAG TPA: ABC transporter ATP-binding protein [Planctomycetota bacterium]|nr:ABC transporter ATP-binding protein [Planctomycetota bacterium]